MVLSTQVADYGSVPTRQKKYLFLAPAMDYGPWRLKEIYGEKEKCFSVALKVQNYVGLRFLQTEKAFLWLFNTLAIVMIPKSISTIRAHDGRISSRISLHGLQSWSFKEKGAARLVDSAANTRATFLKGLIEAGIGRSCL